MKILQTEPFRTSLIQMRQEGKATASLPIADLLAVCEELDFSRNVLQGAGRILEEVRAVMDDAKKIAGSPARKARLAIAIEKIDRFLDPTEDPVDEAAAAKEREEQERLAARSRLVLPKEYRA